MSESSEETHVIIVRDWSINHETGHTRRRKSALPWVALPTAHDDHRYRRLTRLPRGPEIFAAWCLILAIAAKCPLRGVLVDTHNVALNAADLAEMTGFSVELFDMAIEALCDSSIGWLERVTMSELNERKRIAALDAKEQAQTSLPARRQPSKPAPAAVARSTPESNEARIQKIQYLLLVNGILHQVPRELYQSSHITPQWVDKTYNKLWCSLDTLDPLKEFLIKLRERNGELAQAA